MILRITCRYKYMCLDECFIHFNMSAVVVGILKGTIGGLVKKARQVSAAGLEGGDETDGKVRDWIVDGLDDIKRQLKGLERRELLSSLSYMKQGINALYDTLEDADGNMTQPTQEVLSNKTDPISPVNQVDALLTAISSFKKHSENRFTKAVECFKLAGENSTKAFWNEASAIEDRIKAAQIRIISRILEGLEHPDGSVSDSLQYLRELHEVKGVQRTFSVLINGGFKKSFNSSERVDNAKLVYAVNQILFTFARKFSKWLFLDTIKKWPTILLSAVESYHPICGEHRHVAKLEESGLQIRSPLPDMTFGENVYTEMSAVNSTGEIIIALTETERVFKSFQRSRKSQSLVRKIPKKERVSNLVEIAMDVDVNDNLYVVSAFRESSHGSACCKLLIFDSTGNTKGEYPLPFLKSHWPKVRLAVNKDGEIAILDSKSKIVYVGNACSEPCSFQVKKTFTIKKLDHVVGFKFQATANGKRVIVVYPHSICIYRENGHLERHIKITDQKIRSCAINAKQNFLLKTHYRAGCSLVTLSDVGELLDMLCVGPDEWIASAQLCSHPNGHVALVDKNRGTIL